MVVVKSLIIDVKGLINVTPFMASTVTRATRVMFSEVVGCGSGTMVGSGGVSLPTQFSFGPHETPSGISFTWLHTVSTSNVMV